MVPAKGSPTAITHLKEVMIRTKPPGNYVQKSPLHPSLGGCSFANAVPESKAFFFSLMKEILGNCQVVDSKPHWKHTRSRKFRPFAPKRKDRIPLPSGFQGPTVKLWGCMSEIGCCKAAKISRSQNRIEITTTTSLPIVH